MSAQNAKAPGSNTYKLVLALAVVAALAALWHTQIAPRLAARGAVPRAVTPRGNLASDERAAIELFQRSSPSVCFITTAAVRRDWLSFNVFEIPQGTGSGFIWDTDGHIVTNFHVIEKAQTAKVTLADQSTWDATFVGAEPDKDLAVLRITAPKGRLTPIPIGTSSDLQVGQKVFAIGNPFGLDQTLTTGVISGLGREIQSVTQRPIRDVVQTDAAINPGNSGGPLMDSAGRLIGVNTAIYSPSGAYAGVGFAVPVDTVNRIIPQLVRHGEVKRPALGVRIGQDQFSQRTGVEGVLVMEVLPGSGAAAAGMRPTIRAPNGAIQFGDIITAVDGRRVKSSADLLDTLERHKPGETVKVKVRRESETTTLEITLTTVP